jgi:hypothetical protein
MSINITAKIKCQSKTDQGDGDDMRAMLTFAPDYGEGRNASWAAMTPALSLVMTVKAAVAEQFEPGTAYTLTFTPDDDS